MAISKETVQYVANLARIELEADELDKLARQLEDIISFIDKLKELDIERMPLPMLPTGKEISSTFPR